MNAIVSFFSVLVSVNFDVVSNFLPVILKISSATINVAAGSGFCLAFALPATEGSLSDVASELLAHIKRWHGSIKDRFANIANVADLLKMHGDDWDVPTAMNTGMNNSKNQSQSLIDLIDGGRGSAVDRTNRNELLRTAVRYCLHDVRSWAWEQYRLGVLKATDVHSLGFFLPGEIGGNHDRVQLTHVLPAVKVKVLNADWVRIVIDQAVDENAAQVVHGWPDGVRYAIIEIISTETNEEVHHLLTMRLHNDIELPKDSHGKQFLVRASFLVHPGDAPTFHEGTTFSMPLTTRDLIDSIKNYHSEELDAKDAEIERLRAELDAKK
jgi:hypothetical protein